MSLRLKDIFQVHILITVLCSASLSRLKLLSFISLKLVINFQACKTLILLPLKNNGWNQVTSQLCDTILKSYKEAAPHCPLVPEWWVSSILALLSSKTSFILKLFKLLIEWYILSAFSEFKPGSGIYYSVWEARLTRASCVLFWICWILYFFIIPEYSGGGKPLQGGWGIRHFLH